MVEDGRRHCSETLLAMRAPTTMFRSLHDVPHWYQALPQQHSTLSAVGGQVLVLGQLALACWFELTD